MRELHLVSLFHNQHAIFSLSFMHVDFLDRTCLGGSLTRQIRDATGSCRANYGGHYEMCEEAYVSACFVRRMGWTGRDYSVRAGEVYRDDGQAG